MVAGVFFFSSAFSAGGYPKGTSVDGLDRTIEPGVNYETPETRGEKTVGIFYFLWLGCHSYDTGLPTYTGGVQKPSATDVESPYDIQKLLKRTIPELELENFDMHEAENEAAARAQRAEARRDPEIQQAKKEQAARTRRKNKAREAAQAEEVSTRRAKRGGRKAAEKPASGTAHAARKHSNADHGSQQKRGNGSRNASANRAKTNSASGAQGGDFRPGRAHRAQVAHQRNRRR